MPARVYSFACRVDHAASIAPNGTSSHRQTIVSGVASARSSARSAKARPCAPPIARSRARSARSARGAHRRPAAHSPAICPFDEREVHAADAGRLARAVDARRPIVCCASSTTTRAARRSRSRAAARARCSAPVRSRRRARRRRSCASSRPSVDRRPRAPRPSPRAAVTHVPNAVRRAQRTPRGSARPSTSVAGRRHSPSANADHRARRRLLGHEQHARAVGRERRGDGQQQRAAAGDHDALRRRTTRPALSSACAPPTPTTPGSVQPGNGRNRSRAPVASTTARGTRTRARRRRRARRASANPSAAPRTRRPTRRVGAATCAPRAASSAVEPARARRAAAARRRAWRQICPPSARALVEQHDARARLRGARSPPRSRRPAADDGDVARVMLAGSRAVSACARPCRPRPARGTRAGAARRRS